MRIAPLLAGGLILGGLWFLTRSAGAATNCVDLVPGDYFYGTYTGPTRTVKSALGSCYPVNYTIEIYDDETLDWWPPADPMHDKLINGSKCRVKVQAPCVLCGFEPA